jgi:hypothetical protein
LRGQLGVQRRSHEQHQHRHAVDGAADGERADRLSAADETTNTYGIDKNYVLGRVETSQRSTSTTSWERHGPSARTTRTRGVRRSTVVRAPNRGPTGLRIEDVQPFL